jgi:hypothetical protein
MKSPRTKVTIRAMPMPSGRAVKAGRAVLGALAHHPPSEGGEPARMKRPRGGKGPRGGEE